MGNHMGVGIVGANPARGWAFSAHVPALAASDDFTIRAVATTNTTSAEAAAQLTGARPYTSAKALIADPAVELVVVTVKVPFHAEIVADAIAAEKHVLCEWPLAPTTAVAEKLTAAAEHARVRGFIGLQGQFDPAVRWARGLIAAETLGELVGVTVRSSRGARSAAGGVPHASVYTLDAAMAAGTREVLGGHVLSLLRFLLPTVTVRSGRSGRTMGHAIDADTGEQIAVTAPDVLTAELDLGPQAQAMGSMTWFDGDADPGTEIVLVGSAGRIRLWSGDPTAPLAARQPQTMPFQAEFVSVTGDRQTCEPTPNALPMLARNVAAVYAAIAHDLRTGERTAPGFEEALAIHRMLDQVPVASIGR